MFPAFVMLTCRSYKEGAISTEVGHLKLLLHGETYLPESSRSHLQTTFIGQTK